jgi:hypothetical protein
MEIMFKSPLIVKPIPKNGAEYRPDMVEKDSYELSQDLLFDIEGQSFAVPQSFRYDGASIPAIFWQLTFSPFAPDVMRAAAIHDWFYYTHPFGENSKGRNKVDRVFKTMLLMENVSKFKTALMYQAVSLFGWTVWENSDYDRNMLKIVFEKVKKSPNFPLYKFADIL